MLCSCTFKQKHDNLKRNCVPGLHVRHFSIFVLIVLIVYVVFAHVTGVGRPPPWSFSPDVNRSVTAGTVLFWTQFFGQDFASGFGRQPFSECPVRNCSVSSDRREASQSQAIIFHIRDIDLSDLPPTADRHPRQLWIFYLYESPVNTGNNLQPLNNLFNWTMTYRLDSDIPPDLRTEPREQEQEEEQDGTTGGVALKNYARGKTRMAAWIVSNCWTYSHREAYVQELGKYMDIDVFGDCGAERDSCGRNTPLSECYEALQLRYKFYLSFENSVCNDYVTEKWYNVVRYDLVPVVYGGANYSRLAPPHSFIDVQDFPSPRHLADYLHVLDANDTLYNEYFRWRRNFRVIGSQNSMCQLCEKLQSVAGLESEDSKTYVDVDGWWNDGQCKDILTLRLGLPAGWRMNLRHYVDRVSLNLKHSIDWLKTFFQFYFI